MTMPLVDGCLICNGRGQVAEGIACQVCGGTGVATAEQAAQYRQLLVDAAVEAATERFRVAGANAAEGILRGLAQARDDAKETTARAGEVLTALKAARQSAWIAQQAALRVMGAETLVTRAEAAASRTATILAGPLPPDPTDPPPGIVLPAGMGGEIYYFDSLLVRQLDVWGNLNVGGSGGLLSNPMTTLGDLITGGVAGAAQRLGIGGANQVLTVVAGVPAWANSAAGFANPMTTLGDIIIEGAGPAPARLGIGTAGQFLGISGGLPAWANPPSGFANPMTTTGDIIISNPGSTAVRLGVGSAGQVLGVSGGLPAWVTNPAGFTNPMTTAGDMITATAGGTAVRLGIGANGQILTVSGGAVAWAAAGGTPVVALFPSGDTTGAQDDTNFNAAVTSLKPPNTPPGGTIWLAPGQFYTKAGWVLPGQTTTGNSGGFPVNLLGSAGSSVLNVGTAAAAGVTALDYHRTSSYGAQFGNPAQHTIGYIRDLVIDGTNATGAAIGLDCGDGWGGVIDNVTVANFSTAGATGIMFRQRLFWCEKWYFKVNLLNNTTAMYQTTSIPGSDHSHEYCYYDINMFCNQNQNGVVVDGVNNGGSQLFLRGNMCQTSASSGNAPTSNVAMLTIKNTTGQNNAESRWYFGEIWTKVEANRTAAFPDGANGTNTMPYGVFMDGIAQGIKQCEGFISHSLTSSNVNGAEFSFTGGIAGDVGLADLVSSTPGSTSTLIDYSYTATNASPCVFTLSILSNPGVAYPNGCPVQLSGGSPPTGFNNNTVYYVVNSAGATIQLAATPGGAAINSTSIGNGTANVLGPPMPASGTLQQNYGPDQVVCVTGGTVSGISLAGENTGLTSGAFPVPAGGSITVNYTVAPTWAWLPAHQMTY